MKVVSHRRFSYPNFWEEHAWCDVDVYCLALVVLVVLRDQDDHGGTSVTNAIEAVARKVRAELLAPEGLDGLETYWVHWSRADGVASVVSFADKECFEGPQWHYLSPAEFQKILAAFEAPDQMEAWIREGELDVERWEESTQIHRSDREPN